MRNHAMYGAVEVFSIKAGAASVLLGSVLAELYNPLSVCIYPRIRQMLKGISQ